VANARGTGGGAWSLAHRALWAVDRTQVGLRADDIQSMPPPPTPPLPAGAPGRAPPARAGAGGFARLTLERRIGIALACLVVALVVAGVMASVWTTRSALADAFGSRNADTAAALAATLGPLHGDPVETQQLLAGQWASGAYRRLQYLPAVEGAPAFARSVTVTTGAAPRWFVAALGVSPAVGSARVTVDGLPRGNVEVDTTPLAADSLLWEAALDTAVLMATLGALVGLLALLLLARLREQLAPTLAQARVLAGGRFVTAAEPAAPEMQVLTRAMNTMVDRLKAAVDLQVAQVEQLRRHAHVDSLTGLSNRRHFLACLDAALQREDGTAACGLLLMRLRDLAGVNLSLGHAATDRMLSTLAQSLATYAERVPGSIAGRLNGADFALCLPVGGMVQETAQTLAAAMRAVLPTIGPGVAVSLGGAELQHGVTLADAMGRADEALARAELRGPYAVEVLGKARGSAGVTGGESAWRKGLDNALASGSLALAAFPLVDSQGALVHLESPLRLQLEAGSAFEPAALWLPLAVRTRLTAAIDTRAVTLALEAIARDGRARSVNLASATLADGEFASRLRALLFGQARAARLLSIEIDEAAAVERFASLRELARLVRPCGVRFGLEHAGQHLATIDHLFDDWLDFVKLDASLASGAAGDAQRAGYVRAAVELLHGLAIDVYAEGVRDAADAAALWACGIDGITGPWATAHHA
jgi:diguanylate cyclase (GGDEF)-like protein